MNKLLRFSPGLYALPCFLAFLVAGILLGGFGRARANGSFICLDCIGIFQLGRAGTIMGGVALGIAAVLFVFLALSIFFRFREAGGR